jgi:hypothetical protein
MRWYDGSYWNFGGIVPNTPILIDAAVINRVIEGECPRCHVPLERREAGGYCGSCQWTWTAEFSGGHGTVTAAWVE